jgi:hypothetical protein
LRRRQRPWQWQAGAEPWQEFTDLESFINPDVGGPAHMDVPEAAVELEPDTEFLQFLGHM